MKKLLAILLAALMLLSLAACGGTRTQPAAAEPDETTDIAEAPEDAQAKPEEAEEADFIVDGEEIPEEDAEIAEEGAEAPDEDAETEVIIDGEETEIVDGESHMALTGGWELAESPEITPEIAELVEKAQVSMGGTVLTPLAYIGSQLVSGTNHCLFCLNDPTAQDEESVYCILYVYQDLEGNVQVLDMMECNIEVPEGGLAGGWNAPESPVLTEEARAAYDKAMEGVLGVEYTPIALVSEQVVAGMNYCILCQSQVVSPDAERTFSLVYVYADLEGNAELTDVVDFALNAG